MHTETATLLMAPPGAAYLECGQCGAVYGDTETPWRTSPCCQKPLLARYELGPLRAEAQIILATLVSRYRFRCPPEDVPAATSLTLRPLGGLRARLEAR